MTPEEIQKLDEEYENKLNSLIDKYPIRPFIQYLHIDFDEMLCELLTKLGCTKTVKLYESIDKWYE